MRSGAPLCVFLLFCTSYTVPVLSSSWRERLLGQSSSSDTDQPSSSSSRNPLADYFERSDLGECGIEHVYMASIPAGKTEVDYFNGYMDGEYSSSIEECAQQCCKLGQKICQYAWIFTEKCFVIGCTRENARKCVPDSVSQRIPSTYASVRYSTEEGGELAGANSATPSPERAMETTSSATIPLPSTVPPLSHVIATPSTASPIHTQRGKLTVSFAGDTDLTLPTASTRLFASTWPPPNTDEKFVYRWEKVSGPNEGSFDGIDKDQLDLSGLVAGTYTLKLSIHSWLGGERGVGVVNVTVHSAFRDNTPPIPIIKPATHATVTLPLNSALFDASGSRDDLGSDTLTFHWEEVEGPVDSELISDTPVLQLKGLKQGNYRYKLTVTDKDGLSAVTFATVTVNPEPYYPPQALAGEDQLLKLPKNDVTLDGTKSTSYKGELQYSWEKLAGPGPVDMKGTTTPNLHLRFSSTGDYIFRLTVTDSQGLSSSANVSVVVTPEHNLPPRANAGRDLTVVYPSTTATLYGNASTDDFRIDAWAWSQLGGPEDIVMSGSKTPFLEVRGLRIDEALGSPTVYQFELCVWDYHNLTDTANVTLIYKKNPRVPPIVAAGGDVNVTLPQNAIILNGSGTYDDFGIESYKWVRSDASPVAGLVINQSDSQPVLVLSNLVQGTYKYTLAVVNKQKVTASDNVTIQVLPNPLDDYLIQVHLEGDISSFSLTKQQRLERVLGLILDDFDVDYDITVVEVRPFGPHILVEFYAVRADDQTFMNATQAYYKLTDKGQDYYYPQSKFHFLKINMKVCRMPCSGHGSCDRKTHKCSCMRYWMENPIKAHFGKKETNCDWSIFYVALAVLLTVAVLLFLLWLTCCCCMRKRRRARTKRRVRYAILDRKDGEEGRQKLLKDQADYQQTSLMISGSETEEEILFESAKEAETGVSIRTKSIRLPNGKTPAPIVSPTSHQENT